MADVKQEAMLKGIDIVYLTVAVAVGVAAFLSVMGGTLLAVIATI